MSPAAGSGYPIDRAGRGAAGLLAQDRRHPGAGTADRSAGEVLALCRADDYARAGVPMLPVVAGAQETRRQILLYALTLLPAGAAPWVLGLAGPLYGIAAIFAGAGMVGLAWRLRRPRAGGEAALFAYSVVYLFAVFAALLIDHRLFGSA